MHAHPIVLGTAGHIDHGKTALVKALTGIDTDRLKEEKERGITTELGFAHLDAGGRRFGLVDVPGHERFIKSMVAGAGGLDLVCLVIAADEGVMPQTQEHLDICQLLGVRRGVVALAKVDLVEDDWLELVTDEVADYLSGTLLAGAPIVPCSARTGAGLDDLRQALVELTEDLPARDAGGPFRLPLDRIFTIKGFGTVVTGTALGGTVNEGDELVVHPRGLAARVRGIQVHGEAADSARAGMRCAINLGGVATADLARGDVLAHPDGIEPSHILDARFRYLATSKAVLGRRSRILLHHATAQIPATLVLAEQDSLAPGQEALVQLRVDATTPVAALPGDRFIARGFVVQEHYGTTIGGGEIVRVHAPKVRGRAAGQMAEIAGARGDERVALEIASADVAGMSATDAARRLGMADEPLRAALDRLVEAGELIESAGVYMHAEPFARLEKQATDELAARPAGVSKEELRRRLPPSLPPRIYEQLLDALIRRGAAVLDGDVVRKHERKRELSAAAKDLLSRFRDWGARAPKLKQLDADRSALDELVSSGKVVRVKSDYYVAAETIDRLRAALEAHLDAHGELTPAEWKEITGATRKYSIPLGEYFDEIKLTLRIGNVRKRRG